MASTVFKLMRDVHRPNDQRENMRNLGFRLILQRLLCSNTDGLNMADLVHQLSGSQNEQEISELLQDLASAGIVTITWSESGEMVHLCRAYYMSLLSIAYEQEILERFVLNLVQEATYHNFQLTIQLFLHRASSGYHLDSAESMLLLSRLQQKATIVVENSKIYLAEV